MDSDYKIYYGIKSTKELSSDSYVGGQKQRFSALLHGGF